MWSEGRARASAVSRRASSRVLVGLEMRGCSALSWLIVRADGSILPMNVQRFLLGAPIGGSFVSLGVLPSGVSTLFKEESEECLL